MNIHIETERLYIRELLPEDVEGMYEMDSDLLVHRYVGQQPITTRQEAADVIEFVRQQYVDEGIGRWAVLDKQTHDFLGWTGFKMMREAANGHINHYDFGYRHARKAWGRGIATEAAHAALRYGIDVLGFRPVYAMTDVHNGASRHILEQLGFRYVETFKYESQNRWRGPDDLTATWYELPETLAVEHPNNPV